MQDFYAELKDHLMQYPYLDQLSSVKLPITITGIPREGLTVKYQPDGQIDPFEMGKEAAKLIGTVGAGAAGGAAVGAIIGKAVLGGTLARVGVASAGAAIGIPILAPIALVGGAIGSAAYAGYKIANSRRDKEAAEGFTDTLMSHMRQFSPPSETTMLPISRQWPEVEVFVSVPEFGLAALWQPQA